MSELRWILLAAGVALIVGLYLFGTRNRQRPSAADVERATRIDPPRPMPAETARREPRMSFDGADDEAALDLPESPLRMPEATAGRPLDASQVAWREPELASRIETGMRVEPIVREKHEPRSTPAAPVVRWEDVPLRPEAGPPSASQASSTAAYGAASQPEQVSQPAPGVARSPQKIVAIRVTAPHPERFDGSLLHEVVVAARFTHGRYDIFHRLDADGRPVMSLASLLEPGTFEPARMDSAAYPGIAVFTVMPGPLPASRAFDELLDTARSLAHRLGGQLQDDRGAPLSVQRVFKLREEVLAFERSLGSAGSD